MEAGSDDFYAALATVQFADGFASWEEFMDPEWTLLAAWARAGAGTLMVPSRDTLPLWVLSPWLSNLMVFDRMDSGWQKMLSGSAAAKLLPDTGGEAWDGLSETVRHVVGRVESEARPIHQMLPDEASHIGEASVLVLPVGIAIVDRILIAAHPVPEFGSAGS